MEIRERKNGMQEKYFKIYLTSSLRIPGCVINNSMFISNNKLCLQEPKAPVFLLTKQRSLTDRQQVCFKGKTKSGKVMQFHTKIMILTVSISLISRKVMMHCSSVWLKTSDLRKTDQQLLVLYIKHFFIGDPLKQKKHISLIKLHTLSDHL